MMLLRSKRSPAVRLCADAVFLCCALLFSYAETLLPLSVLTGLPGCKLGLANIAILLTALFCGLTDAAAVSLCRVTLTALLFGGVGSFLFSAGGAAASLLLICVLRRAFPAHLSIVAICVGSAAMHNIGQLLAAAVVLSPRAAASYAPMLLLLSVPTGLFSGFISAWMYRAVSPVFKGEDHA